MNNKAIWFRGLWTIFGLLSLFFLIYIFSFDSTIIKKHLHKLILIILHMADHAGGRRSLVNPGTKLWRTTVEVTQFWRPFFIRLKKIIPIKRRGNNMKQRLLEIIQVTVWLHTDELIFLWFYKKRKRAPKPLLGRQNWVTSTVARHTLVPGLTTESRPQAWSAICITYMQSFCFTNISLFVL